MTRAYNAAYKWGRKELVDRNCELVKMVLAGKTLEQAAGAYGLSTARARQLTIKTCRKANPEVFKQALAGNPGFQILSFLRQHKWAFLSHFPEPRE